MQETRKQNFVFEIKKTKDTMTNTEFSYLKHSIYKNCILTKKVLCILWHMKCLWF